LSPELPSAPSNQQDGIAMETSETQGVQSDASSQSHQSEDVPMETEQPYVNNTEDIKMEVDEHETGKEKSQVELGEAGPSSSVSPVSKNRCLPQRAALIKAVLSFLKKSIPDPSFSESIRNGKVCFRCFNCALHDRKIVHYNKLAHCFVSVMDSSLPTSLKYVISNVEYYGPVLFMAGMTYLFQTQSCLHV